MKYLFYSKSSKRKNLPIQTENEANIDKYQTFFSHKYLIHNGKIFFSFY